MSSDVPSTTTDTDRHPVDLVAEDFARRCRAGERPKIDDYAAKHPDLADQLRELLPSIAMMERLKQARRSQSAATATTPKFERLGDFHVIREVGRGGMGVVFEAVQESLNRRVALKVLSSAAMLDPVRVQRFEQEARAAARLHHTNIVPVFGVGSHDGIHYYVMQLIDGQGLGDVARLLARRHPTGVTRQTSAAPRRIEPPEPSQAVTVAISGAAASAARSAASSGPVSTASVSPDASAAGSSASRADPSLGPDYFRWVAQVGQQVAHALQYAHDRGTLHRDVKPSNLILDGSGIVWITDFGLAKVSEDSNVTRTGDIVGTLQYMAPEALNKKADARSDIYGLGLTLYELLVLRPPYGDASAAELIRKITSTDPPRPRSINPRIPRDLETIILKASARDPDHRYPTAAEMAKDLEAYLADRPIKARRVSPIERGWRWCRRNKVVASLGAAVFVSLLLAMAVGWIGYTSTKKALAGESKRRGEAEAATADAKDAKTRAEQATARAEQNVQLSLKAFEEIFNEFSSQQENYAVPRPPPGQSRQFTPRPPREASSTTTANAAVIQKILAFYDRFAQQNATDPVLHAEAARSHLRVGDLYRVLDDTDKADDAYEKAAAIYEQLLTTDAASKHEYAVGLAQAAGLVAPADREPDVNHRQVKRLKRAADILGGADPTKAPEGDIRQLAATFQSLGAFQERLSKTADAETSYRLAMKLWDQVGHPTNGEHPPAGDPQPPPDGQPGSPRGQPFGPPPDVGFADSAIMLAQLMSTQKRDKDARQLLETTIADVEKRRQTRGGPPNGPGPNGGGPNGGGPNGDFRRQTQNEVLPRLYEALADACDRLSDTAAAQKAEQQANRYRQQGPRQGPPGGPNGQGPGPGGPGRPGPGGRGPGQGPPNGPGGPGRDGVDGLPPGPFESDANRPNPAPENRTTTPGKPGR